MDVQEFQNKLKEIQKVAKDQGDSLTAAQIRETFGGSDLNRDQLMGVLRYLSTRGISIEGVAAGEPTEVKEKKKVPLTPEEEAYLKEYTEALPEGGDKEARDAMFQRLSEGDPDAVQTLAACLSSRSCGYGGRNEFRGYFSRGSDSGGECEPYAGSGEVPEKNSGMKHGFWENCAKGSRRYWMNTSQQKFADGSLVAKVEKLENAVRDLSDDEDGKCEFSVAELAVILDMDVEEIRNTLRLTGDDK